MIINLFFFSLISALGFSSFNGSSLFDERRKREKCSHTKIYNALSIEINLSSATLASFYRHQRAPLDKIETWVEKENRKKDNSIIISSNSNNNRNN
ncbi:hypothetical protein Glove_186g35 [Diversispora epigaea]|uniref:HTH psq-type domain-containing protein n=1 Tax=Diversispora epigaea TaxID=1348612 RepID=A0A397IM52_9GLOM|nr:hypothetical protein Glove_186g35 [Diversispora epigaea]